MSSSSLCPAVEKLKPLSSIIYDEEAASITSEEDNGGYVRTGCWAEIDDSQSNGDSDVMLMLWICFCNMLKKKKSIFRNKLEKK